MRPSAAKRKGDGKHRSKPKSKDLEPSPPAEPAPAPPPPRISNHTFGKHSKAVILHMRALGKAAARPAPRPAPRQTYRRATVTAEGLRAERAQREERERAAAKAAKRSPAIQQIWESNSGAVPPVLLVDGYNVLHKWEAVALDMATAGLDPGALGAARERLVHELVSYSQTNGVVVVVAFDAMATGGPGTEEEVAGVKVVYCAREEADTWLVAEARRRLAAGHTHVVVATDDAEPSEGTAALTDASAGRFAWFKRTSALLGAMERSRRALAEQLARAERQAAAAAATRGSLTGMRGALDRLRGTLAEAEQAEWAAQVEAKRAAQEAAREAARQARVALLRAWQAEQEVARLGGTAAGTTSLRGSGGGTPDG